MPYTPDPCARCGELILDDEERVTLYKFGGKRLFPDFSFSGFIYDSTCFTLILEAILEANVSGERVEKAERPC